MVPERWSIKSLGELATVERGKFSARPRNDPKFFGGKMPFVQTGDIAFSNIYLERYTQTLNEAGIAVSKVFPPGTILITIAANIGDTAITRFDVACPDSLVAIQVDPLMADAYWLKKLLETKKSILDSQATQNAQKNINLQVLKPLKVLTPPLIEQKKTSQILSTWDKAITTTEKLLANSQQQKKALMQQLLTGKKRLLDGSGVRFNGEWKRLELGEILNYEQPSKYLVKSTAYDNSYETPVLTAGKTFILGYTDEDSGVFADSLPAIIFDDFTTDSKFVDFPFKAKSSAMKILTAEKNVSLKYVFEAMQLLDFAVGGHQRHWISIYSRLVIPLPEPEEQQAIASVLLSADQEIKVLRQKLETLTQEKKALMQQLLTGKRRVKVNEEAA